jgi:GTPase SAR1 family protein
MTSSSVVAVGLANAGKSTFIAALGYVLLSREIPTELQLDHLAEDMRYISPLIEDWQSCKPFERTKTGLKSVTFHLKDGSHTIGTLNFPDISGETFEQHWELREWEQDFATLSQEASGVLLFLHPLFLEKPYSVVDAARVAKAAGTDSTDDVQGTGNQVSGIPQAVSASSQIAKIESVLWKAQEASSQSKLVDLLQMISRHTTKPVPLKLGVVISAWDVVVDGGGDPTPGNWFEAAAPLLYQFVSMNPELFEARAFGVSAQGGDNVKDGEALRKIDDPSTRIKIVGHNCGNHDLTAPIAWILRNND